MAEPTDPPATLQECLACGNGDLRRACGWCNATGLMSKLQEEAWRQYVRRRNAESATHALLEKMVRHVLEKISFSARAGYADLVLEGVELLEAWQRTAGTNGGERKAAAARLRDFHRRALDFIGGV